MIGELGNKPPSTITSDELRIFQKCFLTAYQTYGYQGELDPRFAYHYNMIQFFQPEYASTVNQLGKDCQQVISLGDLGDCPGFSNIRDQLGALPSNLKQEVPISEWITFSRWLPHQIAKTEVALGRVAEARASLKKAFPSQSAKDLEKLFNRVLTDGTEIREACLSTGTNLRQRAEQGTQDVQGSQVPAEAQGSSSTVVHSRSYVGQSAQEIEAAERAAASESDSSRECYRAIPAEPPNPPRGGKGFFGLNNWLFWGGLVGVAALGFGTWLLRSQKHQKIFTRLKWAVASIKARFEES